MSNRFGAYGFALEGLANAEELLSPAHEEWPLLDVVRLVLGQPEPLDVDAAVPLRGGGLLQMTQTPLRAVYTMPRDISDDELAHPFLVPAAAIAARWHGRQAFHAGGFVNGDGVWGVVGERGSGKSTLLASLASIGVPVVADDMLVLREGVAYPGPRAVDLREEAANELGLGTALDLPGVRQRWRLRLDRAPEPLPLRGWIFLEWGEQTELARLPPATRVDRLLRQRTLQLPDGDPAVLDLVAKPGLVLRRPRAWTTLRRDTETLVEAVTE